jgi:excisionase family DNA binding protein
VARPQPTAAPPAPPPQYRPLAEEAARLGVSVKTLRRRISDGQLAAYRLGHLIRVDPAEVDALLRPIPAAAPRAVEASA